MINNFLRLGTNGNITRAGYATTFHVTGRRISKENMHENYMKMKEKCQSKKLPQDVNPKGVFACNELDLKEVQVYGFDYDYTLACYKPSMDYLLYNLGHNKEHVQSLGAKTGTRMSVVCNFQEIDVLRTETDSNS
ncbi:hypothetical protein PV325_004840 [Microctonus aethiopoides]|nr:hypothetical protein PV325_004840 [Microctonus aethiopoides]